MDELSNEINKIYNLYIEIEKFLTQNKYIFKKEMNLFIKKNKIEKMYVNILSRIFRHKLYKEYLNIYNSYQILFINIKSAVKKHNKEYLKRRKEEFRRICKNVDGKELDEDQLDAIVREDRNQLVIAGAGCGKTTTIVGKVKYLIKVLNVKPSEILLLSYTNASVNDLKNKVEKEIGEEMECFTFHKFGSDITKDNLPSAKTYTYDDFESHIRTIINKLIEKDIENESETDSKYVDKLINYISENTYIKHDDFNYNTEEEYKDYLNKTPYVTFKGERVKSYGELKIANFLFENNIEYEYEAYYEYPTGNEEYADYRPDFYLTEYNIYIEYFGIDRQGNVPKYFTSKHGKTPKEEYNEGIIWKKRTHEQFNTILVDLYYYDLKEDNLLKKLTERLEAMNVDLTPNSKKEIYEKLYKYNSINNIITKIASIITLAKSKKLELSDLKMYACNQYKENILKTIEVIEPIYEEYENYLNENNKIDYNDMINIAIDSIKSNNYVNNYKYVIVDEFQDISFSEAQLLLSLRNLKDYQLFCVGDDFQSIFRFKGSNIGVFLNFDKYFGNTRKSIISKTYRFSNNLSKISGNFILKNPNQIKKELLGYESNINPIEFVYYEEIKNVNERKSNIAEKIYEKLLQLEENSTVYLLGRYSKDNEIIEEKKLFKYWSVNNISCKDREDLKISCKTIHKSKGLEADYIFIVNNREKYYSFPSRIPEFPLINMMLDNSDNYPDSEERRLFYVALTRARKKVFLLVNKENKSCFIEELEEELNNMY